MPFVNEIRGQANEPNNANNQTFKIIVTTTDVTVSVVESGALPALNKMSFLQSILTPSLIPYIYPSNPTDLPPANHIRLFFKLLSGIPTAYVQESNGTVTPWTAASSIILLTDTPDTFLGATSGRHVLAVKSTGDKMIYQKLKDPDIFVVFDPTLNITVVGGPFDGLTYVEKGYDIDEFLLTYASNDVDFPIISPYADNATLDGVGITLSSVTVGSASYIPGIGVSEATHGIGFSIDIHDASINGLAVTDILTWRFRTFSGTSANTSLTESQIEALVNNPLTTSKNGTYSVAANDYKYICWPTSYGTQSLDNFIDTSTGIAVAMDPAAPYTVSVTNTYGATQDYYVYRTQFPIVGALGIRVS